MNISGINNTETLALDQVLPSNLVLVYTYVITIILGLPTNGYVLWLIINGLGGTMATEFFALNLAVNEILFGLFNVISIVYLYLQTEPLRVVYYFSFGFFSFGRPLFQTCICLERYLAVVHPVVFLRYKPVKYRLACCGMVWVIVLGYGSISSIGSFFDQLLYASCALIMVTFGVMLFCCLSVLRALKHPGPGEGERGGEGGKGGKAMKTRAFKILLIILLCTVIPQLPFVMITSFRATMPDSHFYLATKVNFAFFVVTGFVHPLLYLHRVGKLLCLKALL